VEVVGSGLLDGRIFLRGNEQPSRLPLDDVFDELERTGAADIDWHDHAGEEDEISER
jgi:hypothetical protein